MNCHACKDKGFLLVNLEDKLAIQRCDNCRQDLSDAEVLQHVFVTADPVPEKAHWSKIMAEKLVAARQALDRAIDEMGRNDFEGCTVYENVLEVHVLAAQAVQAYEEDHPTDDADKNWLNNHIQFPRLISELDGAGVLTKEVLTSVGLEMDLTLEDVDELVVRASDVYEAIKESMNGKTTP
jgi:hypothetical protein